MPTLVSRTRRRWLWRRPKLLFHPLQERCCNAGGSLLCTLLLLLPDPCPRCWWHQDRAWQQQRWRRPSGGYPAAPAAASTAASLASFSCFQYLL